MPTKSSISPRELFAATTSCNLATSSKTVTAATSKLAISRAAFTPASTTSFLAQGCPKRLRRTIELALLDLRALQLQKYSLILNRPQAESRGLGGDLFLVRRKWRVLLSIDHQDAAQGLGIERRDCQERSNRARGDVVGYFERSFQPVERDPRAMGQHSSEHTIARRDRCVAHVVGGRRKLADSKMRASVVQPEEHRGMQIERASQKVERVMDRLMDLLDARSGQSVVSRFVPIAVLARAEQAVASRVLFESNELSLESGARRSANASDLRAQ